MSDFKGENVFPDTVSKCMLHIQVNRSKKLFYCLLHNCFRNKTFIQYDSVKKYKSGVTMFAFKKHVLIPLKDLKHFIRHGWFECIKRLLLHVIYFEKTFNSCKYNLLTFCNIY